MSYGLLRALRERLLGTRAERPGDDLDPTPAAFAPLLPQRFGPYLVLRKLGQGGTGVVYAAQDDRLERTACWDSRRE